MTRRAILIVALAAVLVGGFFVGQARAETAAEIIDRVFLQPHNSTLTGEDVQNVWRFYGIPPHVTLAIWGAETSMGDPVQGGRLISEGHHNYGCIRYFPGGETSKWGCLATGVVNVGGKDWWSWPDSFTGACAWGRYFKVGVDGRYMQAVKASEYGWYEAVASIYYGRSVPGYSSYLANLKAIHASVLRRAREAGLKW